MNPESQPDPPILPPCGSPEWESTQLQRMDALTRISSNVAHDLNNILIVIKGFTEVLQMSSEFSRESGEHLKKIGTAVDRACAFSAQLAAFGRTFPGTHRLTDLNLIVARLILRVAPLTDRRQGVRLSLSTALPEFHGDPATLEPSLSSLIENASLATPEGGEIAIVVDDASVAPPTTPALLATLEERPVSLTVRDGGPPIPASAALRFFEPFCASKELRRGSGIGLCGTYATIRQHGGWITCTPETPTGNRISLWLPRGKSRAAAKPAIAPPGGKETLMLAGPSDAVARWSTYALSLGYSVMEAPGSKLPGPGTRGTAGPSPDAVVVFAGGADVDEDPVHLAESAARLGHRVLLVASGSVRVSPGKLSAATVAELIPGSVEEPVFARAVRRLFDRKPGPPPGAGLGK